MKTVEFVVYGVAQPKGSMRAFQPKGLARPVLTSSNRNLGQWAALVRHEAQKFAAGVFFQGAVRVQLDFLLPRPPSLPKKVTDHLKKPDLDKLTRAILDALKGPVYRDDSQVVAMVVSKRYQAADAAPCVLVRAYELDAPKTPNAPRPASAQPDLLHGSPPSSTVGH